jgi:DNA-binding transcriptional LysR family regulator
VPTPLSISDLELLVALSQGKTLTEIGRELYVKHPTLSRQIRNAERRTGVQLVERAGRRLRLTSTGEELAAAAAESLAQYRQVNKLAEELKLGEAGTLRVLSTRVASSYILPGVLSEFLKTHSGASLRLDLSGPPEFWRRFAQEGYDVGVGQSTPPASARAELLFSDDVLLVCRGDLPEAKLDASKGVTLQTVIGPVAEPEPSAAWQRLEELGVRVQRKVDVRSHEAVLHLVAEGVGPGLMPRATVRRDLEAGRLAEVPGVGVLAQSQFWLVRRRSPHRFRLAESFLTLLRKQVETFSAPDHVRPSVART